MSKDQRKERQIDNKEGEEGVNIPKFIAQTPWYGGGDITGDSKGQLKAADPLALSVPVAGSGVNEMYRQIGDVLVRDDHSWDSKRDRWHGYSNEEWDQIASSWHQKKKGGINGELQPMMKADGDIDFDNSYDLELAEMGLNEKDMVNQKEDVQEKVLRDRRDVPEYVKRISMQEGKVRTNDEDGQDFVSLKELQRQRQEREKVHRLEQFAWEESSRAERAQEREALAKQMRGIGTGTGEIEVDVGLNLHANPTAIYVKSRQEELKRGEEAKEKRRRLAERYG